MASSSLARNALPLQRQIFSHPSYFLQRALFSTSPNIFARTQPGKPIVLEKPDKFRPPSHPQRVVAKKPTNYGPRLTETQRQEQRTKQYPHMMPPQGSFMHWFLHNRAIHLWIVFSVLTSLALFAFTQNFLLTTPYRDLLPPRSEFLSHPIAFIKQYVTVYKMHVLWLSEQTAEKRRKKLDDVERQKAYRKAHGMSTEPAFFGKLTGKSYGDEEAQGASETAAKAAALLADDGSPKAHQDVTSDGAVQTEERPRKPLKMWFGIW